MERERCKVKNLLSKGHGAEGADTHRNLDTVLILMKAVVTPVGVIEREGFIVVLSRAAIAGVRSLQKEIQIDIKQNMKG
jgi:hypothetical protein